MESILWIVFGLFHRGHPGGYIIGRVFYGVNLKKVGSGNIGATNAYRELGVKAGLAVFICDFMKGFIAVHLGMPDPVIVLLCAVFAIIGNDWSVFLHFKSGKGVACGVGAFTYICAPAVFGSLSGVACYFQVETYCFGGIYFGRTGGALVMLIEGEPLEYVAFGALAAVIVIGKHKDNIGRLLRGEEKPITREKR